jgi:hypothetical protein
LARDLQRAGESSSAALESGPIGVVLEPPPLSFRSTSIDDADCLPHIHGALASKYDSAFLRRVGSFFAIALPSKA